MDAITKSELARRLKISKPRVSQLVKAGMPVLADGRVDAVAACDWIARRVDPTHEIGRTKPTQATPRSEYASSPVVPRSVEPAVTGAKMDAGTVLLHARAKKAIADAKRSERLERFAAGELREVQEMKEFASTVGHIIQDHVLSQADRLSSAVAAMSDVDAIYRLIRDDANAMLMRISKAIADAGAE